MSLSLDVQHRRQVEKLWANQRKTRRSIGDDADDRSLRSMLFVRDIPSEAVTLLTHLYEWQSRILR